jgi:transcription elongation factor/antiterminator RfaH
MSSKAWYLLHSKPHKEHRLDAYLQSQEIETFYPTIHVKPVNPRASTIRPYFPRYLFARVDLEEVGISTFKWAPGATRLVVFGGYPATVPEYIITELRRRVEKIEAAGGINLEELKKGDPVRITDGPLAGYEAIFDLRLSGNDRIQVLLNMLGRQVQVKLDANVIGKK